MAIKEKYEIDLSDRSYDNVIDATKAAYEVSAQNGYVDIKVYRSVMYSSSTEWKRSTLTQVKAHASTLEFQSRERPVGCKGCARD
jgi:hypothetical protein